MIAVAAVAVVAVLVFASSYIWRRNIHTPNPLDAHISFIYEPNHHVKLLRLFREFDAAARSYGYWVCGGTALGLERNGGFIPHDDDIDVAMHHTEFLQFLRDVQSGNILQQFELKKQHDGSFYQIRDKTDPRVFLDVFDTQTVETKAHGNITRFVGLTRVVCGRHWWQTETTLPQLLQRRLFHDVTVNVPIDNPRYLAQAFGHKWAKEYRITHLHTNWFAAATTIFGKFGKLDITSEVADACRRMTQQVTAKHGYVPATT